MIPKDNYLNWQEHTDFLTYLKASGLSKRSIKEYVWYHQKFFKRFGEANPNQQGINQFIEKHNNQPAKTFLKHLITFRKLEGLEIPKMKGSKQKKQKRYISPEEIIEMVDFFEKKNPKYALMLMLSYECALRKKELLSIKVEDFEWNEWHKDKNQNGVLKISHLGAKRQKERSVVVPAALMAVLYNYGKDKGLLKSDYFFGIRSKSTLWHQKFKEAVKHIGKNYMLHELRFSKATFWYRNNVDIMRIKNRLGHSSVYTTQLYIDPSQRDEVEKWKKEIVPTS